MLNSCWEGQEGKGRWVEGVASVRVRHYTQPQLFHTSDPPGWSTVPVGFALAATAPPPHLPLSPSLLVQPFISLRSPLWLFSFISFPSPSFLFFLILYFDFHSPSVTQGMFSFQIRALKRLVTRWCVCICLCVWVRSSVCLARSWCITSNVVSVL